MLIGYILKIKEKFKNNNKTIYIINQILIKEIK